MVKFIDSHSHLAFPAYDADRDEVIGRMKKEEVGAIDIGTTLETSRSAVELARSHDFIWAAVGIHPAFASPNPYHDPNELIEPPVVRSVNENLQGVRELSAGPKVVAIGECGLDYFRFKNEDLGQPTVGQPKAEFKDKQKELLKGHIELAKEVKLPLAIHCRSSAGTQDAYDDLIEILNEHDGLSGTIHFYTGDLEHAKKFIELGFYISFSGVITFAKEYQELVRELPLEKILIETDCPYAPPAPYRGGRNEPVYVIEAARKIAEVKGLTLEGVAAQTTSNTQALFNLTAA